MKIPPCYYGKSFRIDGKEIWLEEIDEEGEPTEEYVEVDEELLEALIANNQIEQ